MYQGIHILSMYSLPLSMGLESISGPLSAQCLDSFTGQMLGMVLGVVLGVWYQDVSTLNMNQCVPQAFHLKILTFIRLFKPRTNLKSHQVTFSSLCFFSSFLDIQIQYFLVKLLPLFRHGSTVFMNQTLGETLIQVLGILSYNKRYTYEVHY